MLLVGAVVQFWSCLPYRVGRCSGGIFAFFALAFLSFLVESISLHQLLSILMAGTPSSSTPRLMLPSIKRVLMPNPTICNLSQETDDEKGQIK